MRLGKVSGSEGVPAVGVKKFLPGFDGSRGQREVNP